MGTSSSFLQTNPLSHAGLGEDASCLEELRAPPDTVLGLNASDTLQVHIAGSP